MPVLTLRAMVCILRQKYARGARRKLLDATAFCVMLLLTRFRAEAGRDQAHGEHIFAFFAAGIVFVNMRR
jgi:hypothetical protein